MTIDQWLDDQINKGYVHPDYKRIYYWVLENYKQYEELYSAETEKEFPCAECGALKRFHKKYCSNYKPRVKQVNG